MIGLSEKIKKHEIAVVGVFCNKGGYPFSYSVGAANQGLYDIYFPYLRIEYSSYFINKIYQLMKNGTIKESCIISGLAANNLRLALVKVTNNYSALLKNEVMCQATNYYKNESYDVYQLVMTDKNNKFPWDDGYQEFVENNKGQQLYFNNYKLDRIQNINVDEVVQNEN